MLLFYSHQVEHIHKNVYYMLLSKKFHVPWELCKWHKMFLLCNKRRKSESLMSVRNYLETESLVNKRCFRAVFRQLCILSNTPVQVRLNQHNRPSTLLLTVSDLRHWALAQKTHCESLFFAQLPGDVHVPGEVRSSQEFWKVKSASLLQLGSRRWRSAP